MKLMDVSSPTPTKTSPKHISPSDLFNLLHKKKMMLKLLVISIYLLCLAAPCSSLHNLLLPSDALSLLAFKSKADIGNKLLFNTSFSHCKWPGVECQLHAKIVRIVIQGLNLGGIFSPNTLTRLDQLRVLSLQDNSLTGPIPDLSGLLNLKALFLDHNYFASSIPPSLSSLHRLKTLDLSYNNLTGIIPPQLNNLDRLYYLRLDSNRFNGSVPPLNQSSLLVFNVSNNNLTGAVPVTPTLVRFSTSSFSLNPLLCGEIVGKECRSTIPFFRNSSEPAAPPSPGQNEQLQGVELAQPNASHHKRRTAAIIGFSTGTLVLISAIVCLLMSIRKQMNQKDSPPIIIATEIDAAAAAMIRMEEENELEEKVRKLQGMQMGKSGSLVFCAGEAQLYSLEQLMTASAELLGKGTVGTTYKAVMDNRLIVCVKRLDASKLAGTKKEAFEQHLSAVGGLRHPNLVPLRAYFQAKEERLLVYDYQTNGSLFSLIHGSKSTRAKPLHWTSCLKIAEDVAQGLAYIHQAWRLVHGNLKSSNVLLGSDFEACLTDYCLSVLVSIPVQDNLDSAAYKAPETQKLNQQETAKSDVYSFGVLLVELLTGKPPSQHPYLMPDDLVKWVKLTRNEEGCGEEDNRMEMLLEVAIACSATLPEQRPTMWQVLKLIQEIKEATVTEDYELDPPPAAATAT